MTIDRKTLVANAMKNIPNRVEEGKEDEVMNKLIGIAFKGISLQEIESHLRDQNSNAYLIAKEPTSRFRFSLIHPSGRNASHYVDLVIGDKNEAQEEALKHPSSLEKNFAKLADAGFLALRLGASPK